MSTIILTRKHMTYLICLFTLIVSVKLTNCMEKNKTPYEEYKELIEATEQNNIQRVKNLIKAGAYVNPFTPGLRAPLHVAAEKGYKDLAIIFIDNNANINVQNSEKETPLFCAAKGGHQSLVQLLLNNSFIEVNTPNRLKKTPLHCAAENGHLAVVKLLAETPSVLINAVDENYKTAIQLAIEHGRREVVLYLLTRPNIKIDIGLHAVAAQKGYAEVMEALLKISDIDLNADIKGTFGKTTLLHVAIENDNTKIVQLLINKNVQVNARNSEGETPLAYAVLHGKPAMVYLLLKASGIDINTTLHKIETFILNPRDDWKSDGVDIYGCTPLHIAAIKGEEEIIKMLLHHPGIRPNELFGSVIIPHASVELALLHKRLTPLTIALRQRYPDEHSIRMLLFNGCKLEINKGGLFQNLFSNEISINPHDRKALGKVFADTPVCLAAVLNNCKELQRLINNKTEQEVIGDALCYAMGQGHKEATDFLLKCVNSATANEAIRLINILLNQDVPTQHKEFYQGVAQKLQAILHPVIPPAPSNAHTIVPPPPSNARVTPKIRTLHQPIHSNETAVSNPFVTRAGLSTSIAPKTTLHHAAHSGEAAVHKPFVTQAVASTHSAPKTKTLHQAALGDKTLVSHLLQNGASVNSVDEEGRTPLHVAIRHNQIDIVKMLIAIQDINVNIADKNGMTPLIEAAQLGHDELIKLLCTIAHINVNVAGKCGRNALHFAALLSHEKVVNLLVTMHHIDINAMNNYGQTPLDLALDKINIHKGIIKKLLRRGGKINNEYKSALQQVFGNNSFLLAVLFNDREKVLQALPPVMDPMKNDAEKKEVKTALIYSVAQGHKEMVQNLLPLCDQSMLEALINRVNVLLTQKLSAPQKAIYEDILGMLKRKISTAVPLSSIGLPRAAERDNQNLHNDPVATRVHNGAPNLRETSERLKKISPLTIAVTQNNMALVKALLAIPAITANAREADGSTPLHYAAGEDYVDAAKILLDHGALVDLENVAGQTPLSVAIKQGSDPLVAMLLQSPHFEVNKPHDDGVTPLHDAVLCDRENVVMQLLHMRNIDVNGIARHGERTMTALDCALIHESLNRNLVPILLSYGAISTERVLLEKWLGNNPLMIAAVFNYPERALSTINQKTDKELVKQILLCALGQGNVTIIEPLLPFGDEQLIQELLDHLDILLTHSLSNERKEHYVNIKSLLQQAAKKLERCSICLHSYQETPEMKAKTLPCTHTFHKECSDRWFTVKKECPLCSKLFEGIDSESLDNRLFIAVGDGNLAMIEELLQKGADGNYEKGITTFTFAVSMGNYTIVKLLLHAMSINPIKNIQECLLLAAEQGKYEIMLALIQEGAIVNVKNEILVTAIKKALHQHSIQFFAMTGNLSAVKSLMLHNDSSIIKEALYYALAQGHAEIVEVILKEYPKRICGFDEILMKMQILLARCQSAELHERYERIIQFVNALSMPMIPARTLPRVRAELFGV